MSYSFAYCSSLKELVLDLSGDNSKSKSMSNAFRNCSSLVSIELAYNNEYEDLSYLFMGCTSLKIMKITNFFNRNVKYMNNLFYDCSSLESISFIPLDLSEEQKENYIINTTNLVDISNMFSGCSSLFYIDLKINTQNIRNYEGLFYNCNNLKFINITYFTHNNLPDSNLSIFNDKINLDTTIFMNRDFYKRINMLIPSNSTKKIYLM
jgi:hypothetical protein